MTVKRAFRVYGLVFSVYKGLGFWSFMGGGRAFGLLYGGSGSKMVFKLVSTVWATIKVMRLHSG